jgi:hypothetical protein
MYGRTTEKKGRGGCGIMHFPFLFLEGHVQGYGTRIKEVRS